MSNSIEFIQIQIHNQSGYDFHNDQHTKVAYQIAANVTG